MDRVRVFSLPLAIFLLAVATVLAFAGVQRLGPWSYQGILTELDDGDLEGAERQRLLRRLLPDATAADLDPLRRLRGQMAAVALDDAAAWDAAAGPDWRPTAEQVPLLGQAGLGDEVVAAYLGALGREAAGDRDAARAAFARAAASSRLFGMRLATRLCQQGQERVR